MIDFATDDTLLPTDRLDLSIRTKVDDIETNKRVYPCKSSDIEPFVEKELVSDSSQYYQNKSAMTDEETTIKARRLVDAWFPKEQLPDEPSP